MIQYHRKPGEYPQGTGPAPQITLADVPPRRYRYQGSDFTTPAAAAVRPRRRPAPRPGSPFIDPGWLDVPFSAPREWHAELAETAAEEAL